jgi:hypothetical protein
MNEEFNPVEYTINPDDFKSFLARLKEKNKDELEKIITHYIDYKPEMVEAALYMSVEKGLMTYDVKEQLSDQIKFNFSDKAQIAKRLKWEAKNAFTSVVARYDDEKIYEIIENPSDIVIDMYHAVLKTALDRELISQNDYGDYYNDGLKASGNEKNNFLDYMNEFYQDMQKEPISDEEIEIMKDEYWKCPSCNELVKMDLSMCWKCGTTIPEQITHPSSVEVIREARDIKSFRPANIGGTLVGTGILILILSSIRGHSLTHFANFKYVDFVLGCLVIVAGITIVIYGMFTKQK